MSWKSISKTLIFCLFSVFSDFGVFTKILWLTWEKKKKKGKRKKEKNEKIIENFTGGWDLLRPSLDPASAEIWFGNLLMLIYINEYNFSPKQKLHLTVYSKKWNIIFDQECNENFYEVFQILWNSEHSTVSRYWL